MSIQFPVVPKVPGVPPLQTFPGTVNLVGSIVGTVLTITTGIAAVSQGLVLSGSGIAPGTTLTAGLTSIQGSSGVSSVNIPQSVGPLSMEASESLNDSGGESQDLLSRDDPSASLGSTDGQWGIYLDGAPVIIPDNIVSVDYKKDWHISDYPIEAGSFESYNKVRQPYESRVVMTRGGTEANRTDFLKLLETLSGSLDLYSIVTPEITYLNASIDHFDYRRTSEKGVSLITVMLWLQEVRLEAISAFSNTATPEGASQVNGGNVQTQPATTTEITTFDERGVTGSW